MAAGEDRDQIFSLKGSVGRSVSKFLDVRSVAIDKSASSVEAEVENALSALQAIRLGRKTLQQALYDEQEQNRELRRLVEELTTYKDQAKRELTAAARMMTAEQERTTFLERSVKSAELRASSLEEWNEKLRNHLDVLVRSINEEDSADSEAANRRASA